MPVLLLNIIDMFFMLNKSGFWGYIKTVSWVPQVWQGCTNHGLQVALTTKFCTVAPNIGGSSLRSMFLVILLVRRILRWLQHFLDNLFAPDLLCWMLGWLRFLGFPQRFCLGCRFSGMWRVAGVVFADVSKEPGAFIFNSWRVQE
jgi:hypothetical protein